MGCCLALPQVVRRVTVGVQCLAGVFLRRGSDCFLHCGEHIEGRREQKAGSCKFASIIDIDSTRPEHGPVMPIAKPAAPRRVPRGEKSERTQASLLEAARKVFAERGFERSTTSEIAQRAGVSEATLFTYFESKRRLCIDVVGRWYDEISTELEEQVPAINGFHAKLQFVIHRHLAHLMGDGIGLCALVLGEGRVVDAEFSGVIAELKRRYTAPLMAALHDARVLGEVRDDAPLRLMRDMVYGAMEHVLWDYVATGIKPSVTATASHLTEMLTAAFACEAPAPRAARRFRADVLAAVRRLERDEGSLDDAS